MDRKLLLLTLFATIVAVTKTLGQECEQNLYIFSDFAKAKNYKAAYEPWKKVYDECPKLHPATFIYGEFIVKDKIKNSINQSEKDKYLDELFTVLDKYREFFPSKINEGEVKVKKAMSLYENKQGDKRIFQLLDDAFNNNKSEFTDEKALYVYFLEIVSLHKKGEYELQKLFDVYDDIVEKIELEKDRLSDAINAFVAKEEANTPLSAREKQRLKNSRIRYENYEKIDESIATTLGNLSDCENLIPLYTRNFEANKTNEQWLRRAAGKMSDKGCTADPLFEKVVTSLHELTPSASSAYFLGVLYDKKGDKTKSLQYYNEAVDLETNNLKKANTLIRIASKLSKSSAVNYAERALKHNPSSAPAYRIIAHEYASSANECGKTAFEKRAIYWLAASVARKGGLEELAKRYDALAPTKADIFQSGLAGQTIKFNCWVGKSVKVPNL